MNRILVILTLDIENLPNNFQEILKHEQEVVAEWKAAGILPFFKLQKSIEYFSLMQQF